MCACIYIIQKVYKLYVAYPLDDDNNDNNATVCWLIPVLLYRNWLVCNGNTCLNEVITTAAVHTAYWIYLLYNHYEQTLHIHHVRPRARVHFTDVYTLTVNCGNCSSFTLFALLYKKKYSSTNTLHLYTFLCEVQNFQGRVGLRPDQQACVPMNPKTEVCDIRNNLRPWKTTASSFYSAAYLWNRFRW